MNCLDVRRASRADPQRLDAEASRHIEQCLACRAFHQRELEFDSRLEQALRVSVPERLEARILDRKAPRRAVRWLALAASLLVVATIGYFAGSPRPDPLALAAIDFVVFEEARTIVDAKPTDFNLLLRVAREMGVSVSKQLGEIRYICAYPFAGGAAHHLFVKTPLGKVTVLLLLGRPIASRALAAARGLEAAVMPAAGGSVAIIGDSPQSIRRAASLLGAS
jgi:hypothetical protein